MTPISLDNSEIEEIISICNTQMKHLAMQRKKLLSLTERFIDDTVNSSAVESYENINFREFQDADSDRIIFSILNESNTILSLEDITDYIKRKNDFRGFDKNEVLKKVIARIKLLSKEPTILRCVKEKISRKKFYALPSWFYSNGSIKKRYRIFNMN